MHKHKTPSRKNFFEWLYNRIAKKISPFLINSKITANQVTFISGIFGIIAAILLTTENHLNLILAGILINLYVIFDLVDGDLARYKNQCNAFGQWFDTFFDKFNLMVIIVGLTLGVYKESQNPAHIISGMLLMGFMFFSQFTIMYINQIFKDQESVKQNNESTILLTKKTEFIDNKPRLKAFIKFVLKHFPCGDIPFLFFTSLFAFTNILHLGLFFLTIYSGITLIIICTVAFVELKAKFSNR